MLGGGGGTFRGKYRAENRIGRPIRDLSPRGRRGASFSFHLRLTHVKALRVDMYIHVYVYVYIPDIDRLVGGGWPAFAMASIE